MTRRQSGSEDEQAPIGPASSRHPAAAVQPVAQGEPDRPWYLFRVDDNGNRFAMARLATRADAEALARLFEARGHKQTYYVVSEP